MAKSWQLQHAKARFSEVVKNALHQGPQEITLHGHSAAVVLSKKDYDRLFAHKPSFTEFMRQSPWVGLDLKLDRDKSPARPVEL